MEKRKTKCSGYGMFTGIYGVMGLGLLLGILIGLPVRTVDGWQNSPSEWAAVIACGIALAYTVLSGLDWIVEKRALAANLLPDELDLSERAGASGPQVVAMAGAQMFRLFGLLAAESLIIFAMLVAAAGFAAPGVLLTLSSGLMVLLVLSAMARFQLAAHLAGYIESNLLARIGNDTPAAAGLEFAQAVGKSVSTATAGLADAQSRLADQLAKIQSDAAALTAKAQTDASAQIAKAQQDAAAQIAKTQSDATAHLAKAQDQVAEQLGRLSDLAATIDRIFQLQQAVDGALQGVAVSDEFKSTLSGLRQHLAASDELLKNASKPRTIRLVEKDNE